MGFYKDKDVGKSERVGPTAKDMEHGLIEYGAYRTIL